MGCGEGFISRKSPPTVPAKPPPMALAFILSRGVRASSPPHSLTTTLRETRVVCYKVVTATTPLLCMACGEGGY